jgi:hypothetical protein
LVYQRAVELGQEAVLGEEDFVFPDKQLEATSKETSIALVRTAAGVMGHKLTDAAGRQRFSGHTPRPSGAIFYAKRGVAKWVIQVLARWKSEVIDRYLRDVMAWRTTTIASELEKAEEEERKRRKKEEATRLALCGEESLNLAEEPEREEPEQEEELEEPEGAEEEEGKDGEEEEKKATTL